MWLHAWLMRGLKYRLTELRAKHATGLNTCGINGETGDLADMKDIGVWEPSPSRLR